MSTNPRYERCGVCGGWLTRCTNGVYRHRRGDGSRCNALLAGKVRSIRDHGVIPALPLPASGSQLCLFCREVAEVDPGGLCPACLGKRQVELESV